MIALPLELNLTLIQCKKVSDEWKAGNFFADPNPKAPHFFTILVGTKPTLMFGRNGQNFGAPVVSSNNYQNCFYYWRHSLRTKFLILELTPTKRICVDHVKGFKELSQKCKNGKIMEGRLFLGYYRRRVSTFYPLIRFHFSVKISIPVEEEDAQMHELNEVAKLGDG